MDKTDLRLTIVTLHASLDGEALPLGAASVAAALVDAGLVERGNAFLVDAGLGEKEEDVLRRIVAREPTMVGFSLYCWNSRRSIALASRLKREYPGVVIVAGGPDAEWLAAKAEDPEASSPAFPFDAVFLGEGEASLPLWLSGSKTEAPRFIRGAPAAVENLASPWLDGLLLPRRGGQVTWELTRGCPFRCTYCYEGRGVSGLRHLPMERLSRELDLFVEKGVARVFVLDPTFNIQNARTLSLLALFAKKAPGIDWYFEVRAELLDRAQAKAFADISCSLQIGLQSSRPEILAAIGRDVDRKKFAAKIALLNERGVVFGFDLIYGLPGDSLAGFRESVDFALSLEPNHLDIFPLAVLPGTLLHDQIKEFSLDCDDEPPYLLRGQPGFPARDMEKAGRLARSCGVFYSEGRAVPWFKAVVKPLRMSPSAFLAGFRAPESSVLLPHRRIEELQSSYLTEIYEKRGKSRLLPAVLDLLRYHGAWSRAFAEGETTRINLHYPLRSVEGPEILSIENFVLRNAPQPCAIEVRPAKSGPIAKIL